MAWATPVTHVTGDVVSASDWNIGSNDLTFLSGQITTLNGDTGWTNVTVFTGTWVAGSIQPRFIRFGNVVTMQGYVQSGSINTAAFTLPTGYRPTETLAMAVDANAAYGRLVIASTGVVTPAAGATTNFSITSAFSII